METIVSSKKKTSKPSRKRIVAIPRKLTNPLGRKIQKNIKEIALITSYPPRECGIATFSKDLVSALNEKFKDSFNLSIFPLESGTDSHNYSDKVSHTLNTDTELDYLKTAREINSNKNCGIVLIQHEFGLFNGNDEPFYDFLEFLDKPIVFTFHTVLPSPGDKLRRKVVRMANQASAIIVMTETSALLLQEEYDIDSDKITVIPHGTHLVCYDDKEALKKKYKLENKKVLSTFGLLGPGKSIETTLRALPRIVQEHPETIFLILGKTHPTLAKEKGEDYREFLKYKIEKLGLSENVRFINKFLPLDELLEYLQLTDTYLFTSKDPNQAVSGTFAYALSCGCPIISTPIPHALEVLQNEAGVLFDFEDSEQLADATIDLLNDEVVQHQMSLNGLHSTAESAWENAAIAHAKLFEKISSPKLKLQYEQPDVKLTHLKKMTTETGVIQFSKTNRPDLDSGYTLDDNARALIALCNHYKLFSEESDLKYIRIYFNFIKNCFRPDATFLNYVNQDHVFTNQNDEVNLEDSNGRALWALGYLISLSVVMKNRNDAIFRNAECIFQRGLETMINFQSPRAIAFILKGLYYFNLNRTNASLPNTVKILANRLVDRYETSNSLDWNWYEPYLTYGNSVIPEGLLMAYIITGEERYKVIAKDSFDFLLSKIFKGNSIQVVSNDKWLSKGQELPTEFIGGEQPIDVAYTILALETFQETFPNEDYGEKMLGAFNWFMGDNALKQTIYNPCTGGCYDGLEKHNVNLNQGAESTVSYLLARMAFEKTSE